jgi:hypothetical protein
VALPALADLLPGLDLGSEHRVPPACLVDIRLVPTLTRVGWSVSWQALTEENWPFV